LVVFFKGVVCFGVLRKICVFKDNGAEGGGGVAVALKERKFCLDADTSN